MPEMRIRLVPSSAVAASCLTAWLLLVVACVPRPATLASPSGAVASASSGRSAPAPSGPVGPTPTPSFVRPTPLPAPTFLAYTVKSHDTLTSIAQAFHTTPRSIAFWSRGEHPSLDPQSPGYRPDRLEIGWVLLLVPDAVFDEDELLDATPSPEPNVTPS
jgi:hypothetical protein